MAALAALAARVAAQLGRRVPGLLPAVGAGIAGAGLGGALFNGEEPKRRRRRRKALTDNDVKTALILASSISKKAAENFILVRVKGS